MRDFIVNLSKEILTDLLTSSITTAKLVTTKSLKLPTIAFRNIGTFLTNLQIAKTNLTLDEARKLGFDSSVYGILLKYDEMAVYNVYLLDFLKNKPNIPRNKKFTAYIYIQKEVDLRPEKNVYTDLLESLEWKEFETELDGNTEVPTHDFDYLTADKFLDYVSKTYYLQNFDSCIADSIVCDTTIYPWYSIVIQNIELTFGHPNKNKNVWCFGSAPMSDDPFEIQRTANLDSSFTYKILPSNWHEIVKGIKAYYA